MKKYLVGIVSVVLFACNTAPSKTNTSERIVCVSKQYNEIICALGAQQNLVGVDVSSTYPSALKDVPKVGYHRALGVEGIVSLNPTLFIHDNNVGPENVMQQLKDLNIPMRSFIKAETIDSTKLLIHEIGTYFHKEKQADSLCMELDQDFELALKNKSLFNTPVRVAIIHYGQASNTYLVMTSKSTGAKMVDWAGGQLCIADGQKGMKPLSAEILAEANPDVILVTDFGYDKLGSMESIKSLPGVSETSASKTNHIFRIEEHDLVYLGPRTGKNVLALQELIHRK